MAYLFPEIFLCALGCIGLIAACYPGRDRGTSLAVVGGVGCLIAAPIAGYIAYLAATLPERQMVAELPSYIRTTFAIDGFSRAFATLALLVCGISYLFSVEYLRCRVRDHQAEFLALIALASLGVSCLASGRDLLTVWFSLELLSITGYVMAAYLRTDERSIEAALKYFLLGATASALMLFGMSYLYGLTGRLDLEGLGQVLRREPVGPLLPAAALLVAVGFGFKIAMVPFHMWCPDVYEGAPTPVTAFLSVGPKLAGFAAIVRVMLSAFAETDAGAVWETALVILAIATMTVGNLVALRQTNIKRLLAYSSIAHAGYMLVGVIAMGYSALAVPAIALYALAYALMNLGAFAVVIGFSNSTGDDRLLAYEGLASRSPFLAAAWVVFALSLVGIPPTGGWLGKLYILMAAWEGKLFVPMVVLIVNSVVSLYYYFEVARRMYLCKPFKTSRISVGAGAGTAIGLALAGTVLMVVFADPLLEAVQRVALR